MKKKFNKIYFISITLISFIGFFLYTNTLLSNEQSQIYATIVPINEAQISSEITAKIKKIYFRVGESFKKNDQLIEFNCQHIQIEINKIQAKLKSTNANYQSAEKLKKLDSISDVELLSAESEHKQTLAELDQLKYNQSLCLIKAPYNGEVVGQFVNENETVKR